MLYNALAVCAAADCCNLPPTAVAQAIRSFAPQNGRLQRYVIDGRNVLLNLAKNPTGFNQNLRIVTTEKGPKAVAFFINDKEADGHDVSWLWDVDFQELSCVEDMIVFAGGTRRNDMQVRLKYAGIDAELVDGASDFLAKARAASADADLFLIANYTALPDVKTELDKTQRHSSKLEPLRVKIHEKAHLEAFPAINAGDAAVAPISPDAADAYISKATLTIVHMYPELLNLYGDGGNVTVLAQRARARGLNVNVVHVSHGQKADLESADIVFLGGGPDREQHLASRDLLEQADDLRSYVEDDGVLLAICGGYQILGREWLLGDESVAGLSILDMATKRAEGGSHNRLVGNIALESPLASMPVIGYENHAGRTFLGSRCSPFGRVIGKHGKGNNDEDGVDGARYRNVLGTYLHGPLLSKNPEIADWLIERAIERRAKKIDRSATTLAPLDDSVERAANEFMCKKLSVSSETRHIGADDSI